MGIRELEISLNDEQQAVKDAARKFFGEVWRPAAIELDKMANPEEVIAEDSVLWDVFKKTNELGYHKMAAPEEVGGLGMDDSLIAAIICEEMGYASPGLAVGYAVNATPYNYAMMSPVPEVQGLYSQFIQDTGVKMTGCWAITEPNHGSDWLHFEGEHTSDPAFAGQVRAVLDGDHYVIKGQKAAWVSNGTFASHAGLFLNLDASKGMQAAGIAAMPLDLEGISRGKPLDKMGQRDLNQGEIFFDDVRLPKEYMVVSDPAVYKVAIDAQLALANMWMGCVFCGTAHSAFDEALKYARERIQGGKPIIEHQNIKLKLFDMFASVEAARSLSRRVWVYNSEQTKTMQPTALEYSIASKVMATETSFKAASEAVQVFGGNGLSREYVIEKIFRDARAAMIEDGVNETLALVGAGRL